MNDTMDPTAGAPLPVLLIEDDPAIQRFVAMGLEDLPVQLCIVGTVAEGLRVLEQGPVALILLDLMLPDAPGTELLAQLRLRPALKGAARVAVFSAGLNANKRAELAAFEIHHILPKPAALSDLRACVDEARPVMPPRAGGVGPSAVDRYFEGDADLYESFRSAAREQFPHDIVAGDLACREADLSRLRRIAHSLRTVMVTLGDVRAAKAAAALEDAALADPIMAPALWPPLREALQHHVQTASEGTL